jgi:MFS transporter, PHS family, inorganic phosphate transporter
MLINPVLSCISFNIPGPNTTTFIVPGECFPTRYRSTSHGISAAAGKVGSIIAQAVFGPLRTHGAPSNCSGAACSPWLNHVMQIFALFMLCGLFTTFLIPETARKTLEELTGEDLGGENSISSTDNKEAPETGVENETNLSEVKG